MSTTSIGRSGEQLVAEYLQNSGYTVLMQNWRTRWCEIDIICKKAGCIYFVEVKSRKSDVFGDGLAYITPKKLQQMRFAAEFWAASQRWTGDYQLCAASVQTNDGTIEYIENI
jgi:uncharacterized protein (TIGR00252 family)